MKFGRLNADMFTRSFGAVAYLPAQESIYTEQLMAFSDRYIFA